MYSARTFIRLRRPGIDSKESIPIAYVACRAGTKTLFVVCHFYSNAFKKKNVKAHGRKGYKALQLLRHMCIGAILYPNWRVFCNAQ
jgi:hypothetical protein